MNFTLAVLAFSRISLNSLSLSVFRSVTVMEAFCGYRERLFAGLDFAMALSQRPFFPYVVLEPCLSP